jgi:hypothetical protein
MIEAFLIDRFRPGVALSRFRPVLISPFGFIHGSDFMLQRVFQSHSMRFALVLMLGLATGCGGSGKRDEKYATVEGTVKHGGKAVPSGANLILENKTQGVRMSFAIGADGKFQINETSKLPEGTYNVAVTPPADSGVSEADYEAAMSNPEAAAKTAETKTDNFPVPEQFRDPDKSKKTIEVKAGSQTLDIEL